MKKRWIGYPSVLSRSPGPPSRQTTSGNACRICVRPSIGPSSISNARVPAWRKLSPKPGCIRVASGEFCATWPVKWRRKITINLRPAMSETRSNPKASLLFNEAMIGAAATEDTLVCRLAEEMIRRWRAGDRVRAEELLDRHPELWHSPEHGLEIIYEEICLRREKCADDDAGDVLGRFPQWSPQLKVMLECHRL